jgi:hypothetical protein
VVFAANLAAAAASRVSVLTAIATHGPSSPIDSRVSSIIAGE